MLGVMSMLSFRNPLSVSGKWASHIIILSTFLVALSIVVLLISPAKGQLILDQQRGVVTIAPLLENTTSAVVNIAVETELPADENPLMRDPFFRRFFGLPEGVPKRRSQSAGSGVIIDADKGIILTNHHVVANATKIIVTIKDSRQLSAKLIGSDPATDIGVLQVNADDLADLTLGDSDILKVGDLVVAIGNPFGLGQTVTTGIVSALGRGGLSAEKYEDFIQTDASINPGNSGGALINSKGELIGINTAIIAPSGGNVGIGFAVPSNMAKAVMNQILKYGEVRRGRVGISIQTITPDIAKALNLPVNRGAVITTVEKNSSAEQTGLKPGDAITEIDGKAIEDSDDVRNRIGLRERGSYVALTFYRKGKKQNVKLKIGDPPVTEIKDVEAIEKLSGAQFKEIPDNHPFKNQVKGVIVSDVQPGSRAYRIGLQTGDIITAVNQKQISSIKDFVNYTKKADAVLALNIIRGDEQFFVVVQ